MKVNNKFKTIPYRHQEQAYEKSDNKTAFAYLMEMGTGKSKSLLDDIARLYSKKQIDFAIIIAPKGVYRNWLELEIPAHFWDDLPVSVSSWQSPNDQRTQTRD